MKSRLKIIIICLSYLLIPAALFYFAEPAEAQEMGSLWGSNQWWDWSDFRGGGGARVFMSRLSSATLTKGGKTYNLNGTTYKFNSDPTPFNDAWGVLYVDRLGIRMVAESHLFKGGHEAPALPFSELSLDNSRIGVDLELIRYPFLRFGINYDYIFSPYKFWDRSNVPAGTEEELYQTSNPMTLGIHGLGIPFRVKGIPAIIQGRLRFPVPFLNRASEAKITDWELSAGLRPSIWDTSLYGFSTFSVGLEGGYRSLNVNMTAEKDTPGDPPNIELKARWEGAFVQLSILF